MVTTERRRPAYRSRMGHPVTGGRTAVPDMSGAVAPFFPSKFRRTTFHFTRQEAR
jgi:hypothetical protein